MTPSPSEIYDRALDVLSWPIAAVIFLCCVTVSAVTFGVPGFFFGIAAGILLAKLAKPIAELWPVVLIGVVLGLLRQVL